MPEECEAQTVARILKKMLISLKKVGRRISGAKRVWYALRPPENRSPSYWLIPRETWESQYLAGHWNYLGQLEQLARYSVIVGYIQHLKPGGSFLDVGCGEGLLREKLSLYGYSKYLGIDIFEAAIGKAAQRQHERTHFIRADADDYEPAELFDAIIFNEILYYLKDPVKILDRYTRALREGGIIITSIFAVEPGPSVLEKIKAAGYSVLDEVTTEHESRVVVHPQLPSRKVWICSVFVPASGRDLA